MWIQLIKLAAEYPNVIEEIRGSGLMIGIKCKTENTVLRGKLLDAGMLSVGAEDNVIRILPPLIIKNSHIDEAIQILSDVCARIEEGP